MSFSSIAVHAFGCARRTGRPLYAVIRDADCQENGYDARGVPHGRSRRSGQAMQQSSRQYCAADRSNSGLIGGDAGPAPRGGGERAVSSAGRTFSA